MEAGDSILGTQLRRQQLSEPPFPRFAFLAAWIPPFPVAPSLCCHLGKESDGAPASALGSLRLRVQRPALSLALLACPPQRGGVGWGWGLYLGCWKKDGLHSHSYGKQAGQEGL